MSGDAKPGRSKVVPLRPARQCPICGRRAAHEAYPFCSKRCSDVDLNRWLSGSYVIAGDPADGLSAPEDQ